MSDALLKLPCHHPLLWHWGGHVVPYTRMTQRSKFADPRARAYLECKTFLADHLRREAREFVLPPAPTNAKARRQYNAFMRKARYRLGVEWMTPTMEGDLSNVIKLVEDALQEAGLLWDDKLITGFDFAEKFVHNDELLTIKLTRVPINHVNRKR